MSEQHWQRQVEEIAKTYGWRLFHAPDNRPIQARSGRRYVQSIEAGFPDLVLVKRPRLLFIELKTSTGRVSVEQKSWLDDLAASGVEVAVWRPYNLPDIVRSLGPRDQPLPAWPWEA